MHPLLLSLWLVSSTGIPGKLDIAVGPSFHRFGGPISEETGWIPGFNLDVGVAVTGEVARAKAPKKWKGAIPKDGEIVVRPWWLVVVPRQVLLSPGAPLTTVGMTWSFFGLSSGLDFTPSTKLKVGVQLPEISWLAAWGPATPRASSVWSLGISPNAHFQIEPTSWLRLDLGWAHHLDIPFGAITLNNSRQIPWTWGSAYLQLHVRPGITI